MDFNEIRKSLKQSMDKIDELWRSLWHSYKGN